MTYSQRWWCSSSSSRPPPYFSSFIWRHVTSMAHKNILWDGPARHDACWLPTVDLKLFVRSRTGSHYSARHSLRHISHRTSLTHENISLDEFKVLCVRRYLPSCAWRGHALKWCMWCAYSVIVWNGTDAAMFDDWEEEQVNEGVWICPLVHPTNHIHMFFSPSV